MKKIVVIEDEQVLLKALNIELLSANYSVMSASDGQAGIALIKKEKPDLVLLDLVMPKMTGFEVLAEMKAVKDLKDIPVIILSNLGQDEDHKKAMELGAVDYYVKSDADLSTITKKIQKILK